MSEANELVELIRGRIHAEFDGECHLTDTEAHRIANFLSEAEKREKEARAKALEEAAQVAETFKRRRLGRDLSKAYFDPCGRWEGGEIHEEGKERDLIASRIRAISHVPLTEPELVDALSALQSEER